MESHYHINLEKIWHLKYWILEPNYNVISSTIMEIMQDAGTTNAMFLVTFVRMVLAEAVEMQIKLYFFT